MSIHIKTLCAILILSSGAQQISVPAAKKADLRPASDVAAFLSKATGVSIFVDSRLLKEQCPMPDGEVTVDNLGEHIAALAKGLPKGATWCKLNLPPPPKGKTWKADDLIEFALAQSRLYGRVGISEPGKTEILSQQIATEKALPMVSTLDLKPVYLITLEHSSFTGTWSTTFGQMQLKQSGNKVSGTYTSGGGVIEGTVNGRVMKFQWYETGSRRGGPGVFTLAADGESFSGEWSYDETTDMPSTWIGTRISRR